MSHEVDLQVSRIRFMPIGEGADRDLFFHPWRGFGSFATPRLFPDRSEEAVNSCGACLKKAALDFRVEFQVAVPLH